MHDQGTIRDLLQTNDLAVERALLALYERQTEVEKRVNHSTHLNMRGFNQGDAPDMSSMAKQILNGRHLDARQLEWLRAPQHRYRSRIGKYWRQLLEIAREREARRQAAEQAA